MRKDLIERVYTLLRSEVPLDDIDASGMAAVVYACYAKFDGVMGY